MAVLARMHLRHVPCHASRVNDANMLPLSPFPHNDAVTKQQAYWCTQVWHQQVPQPLGLASPLCSSTGTGTCHDLVGCGVNPSLDTNDGFQQLYMLPMTA